ncbi:hypothetical protein LTR16_004546, partial [Cryomyces antarcticus]
QWHLDEPLLVRDLLDRLREPSLGALCQHGADHQHASRFRRRERPSRVRRLPRLWRGWDLRKTHCLGHLRLQYWSLRNERQRGEERHHSPTGCRVQSLHPPPCQQLPERCEPCKLLSEPDHEPLRAYRARCKPGWERIRLPVRRCHAGWRRAARRCGEQWQPCAVDNRSWRTERLRV